MLPQSISIATFLVALCAVYVHAIDPPKIEPSYTVLYILEKRGVNMTCTSTSDSVEWTRNNQQVTEFGFKRSKKVDMELGSDDQVSLTISKALTEVSDSGLYVCSADNQNRQIELKVVSVTPTNAEYDKSLATTTLVCAVNNVDSSAYTLKWVFKDEVLDNNDKYTIHTDNNSLVITDPEHKDSGEYFCTLSFSDNKQSITVPVNFYAAPYLKKFDKSKNLIQGDPLNLRCEVYSNPPAVITWRKDGKSVDEIEGVEVVDDTTTGLKNGLLKIPSVSFEDKGNYMCIAENKYFNLSSNRTILVRVKDKLAALWPFLGIVAEVVVLCVIIFIYEKKRSRSEDDEDAADAGNCANAADHKGKDEVRQRNVRA